MLDAADRMLPPEARGVEPIVPEGTDLAVWCYTSAGRLYGIAFAGKAKKPLWHYRFRDHAGLQRQIDYSAGIRRQKAAATAQRKLERKEFDHGMKVGDVLYHSWGYDQTNINFFEVVAVHGKSVTLREVASEVVRSERGADYVSAVPGRYVGAAMKKLPRGSTGNVSVKMDHGHAYPWDGRPKYQTASGWGH